MIHSWWILLLLGWGAVAAVMLGLWARASAVEDASAVDAGWGYAIALLAACTRRWPTAIAACCARRRTRAT